METNKVIVNLPEGFNKENFTLNIREGKAPVILDELEPSSLDVFGSITTPFLILKKEVQKDKKGVGNDSYIMVDRDKLEIHASIFSTDQRKKINAIGKLEISKDIKECCIDSGTVFDPNTLADLFRKKRSWFVDKGINMMVVNNLKNLKSNINKSLETSKDDKAANASLSINLAVETTLIKESFELCMPMFKGTENVKFPVEIYPDVSTGNVLVYLDSPEYYELKDCKTKELFDKEMEKISSLIDIPIVEK